MERRIDLPALKQLSSLITLDVWVLIGELLAMAAQYVMFELQGPDAPLMDVILYLTWSMRVVRLVTWALIIASLTRLSDLHRGYNQARLCYLLRILAFVVICVFESISNRLSVYGLIPQTMSPLLALALSLCLLSETLPLAIGNRAILRANASLMERFGIPDPSANSLRCGNWLIALAMSAGILFFADLNLSHRVWVKTGFALFQRIDAQGAATPSLIGCLTACALVGFGYVFCLVAAAGQTRRCHRLIKGLTE